MYHKIKQKPYLYIFEYDKEYNGHQVVKESEQKMQIVGGKALQDLSLKKREREHLNVII